MEGKLEELKEMKDLERKDLVVELQIPLSRFLQWMNVSVYYYQCYTNTNKIPSSVVVEGRFGKLLLFLGTLYEQHGKANGVFGSSNCPQGTSISVEGYDNGRTSLARKYLFRSVIL